MYKQNSGAHKLYNTALHRRLSDMYTHVTEEDKNTLQEDLKRHWKYGRTHGRCHSILLNVQSWLFQTKRNHSSETMPFVGRHFVIQVLNHILESNLIASYRGGGGEHVGNTVAKANRTLGFFRRNLWFCPKETCQNNGIHST